MARDARLWKRNLFVIPGGLLATYSGLFLLDLLLLRPSTGPCQDPHRILYHGLCYNVLPWLAALLLVGLVLVAIGAFAFRGRPQTLAGHLEHGTPVHFALALLVSFAVVPILAAGIAMYFQSAQGNVFVTGFRGSSFRTDFLLGIVAVVGICLLLPFALLLASQRRLRLDFLAAAEAGEAPETFPGEPGGDDGYKEEPWPESRAAEHAALAAATPTPAGAAAAPVVKQAGGCKYMLGTGSHCGAEVGPGGLYCLRHACQGQTASGAACRNPALAGTSRCRAHTAGNP
ncbi:MAG: hypothetical protein QOD77_1606 [Thermoplasmata archaeon]|jgi:hypothetical protein|nr:hypothetical protein [Thermoplasmata archaeon]